jgi:hypothetical protein
MNGRARRILKKTKKREKEKEERKKKRNREGTKFIICIRRWRKFKNIFEKTFNNKNISFFRIKITHSLISNNYLIFMVNVLHSVRWYKLQE